MCSPWSHNLIKEGLLWFLLHNVLCRFSSVGVVRVQCTCSFSLLLAAAHLWFTCIRGVFKRTSHLFSEWCTPQALNLPRESLKPAPSNTNQHVFVWKQWLLQTRTEMKVTDEQWPSVTPVVINACLRFIHSLVGTGKDLPKWTFVNFTPKFFCYGPK